MKLSEKRKKLLRGLVISVLLAAVAGAVFLFVARKYIAARRSEGESRLSQINEAVDTQRTRRGTIESMKREITAGLASGSRLYEYDCERQELDHLSQLMEHAEVYDIAFDEPFASESSYVRRGVRVSLKAENYAAARTVIDGIISSPYRTIVRNITITAIEQDPEATLIDRSLSGNCRVSVNIDMVFIEYVNQQSDNRGLKQR